MDLTGFFGTNPLLIFVLLAWSILWKGLALWKSAQNNQRYWFIVMLVVSSLGILEMIYLFGFAKKRLSMKEIQSWFGK
ncbi:MAG: DUF5652 family protein [Candidatus Levyibacteriota bacterium]